MQVSARNMFLGKVVDLRRDAVSTEVTLTLKGGKALYALITNESADALGLRPGMSVYAFFKANAVILGKGLHDATVSTRNLLCGRADKIVPGPVHVDVSVTLPDGSILTAVVTRESATRRLALAVGDHVCALVEASSVILGVDG